jgi:hypothetical protein
MTESSGMMRAGAAAPLETLALLGPPPLARGEDVAAYNELLARLCATLRPSDSLEEIWIRDVVDLVWDTIRLRRIRMKAWLLTYRTEREVRSKLKPGFDDAEKMGRSWATGDEAAAKQVEQALITVGFSIEIAMALSMLGLIGVVERIDRMLVSAEARRSAALREIDHHRGPFAQKLRRAIAQAEASEMRADAPPIAAQAQPA